MREHTNTLKLPDLSSLCVSKGSTQSGKSYHLDSEKERKKVYRTHWLNHYCEVIHILDTTLEQIKTITVVSEILHTEIKWKK